MIGTVLVHWQSQPTAFGIEAHTVGNGGHVLLDGVEADHRVEVVKQVVGRVRLWQQGVGIDVLGRHFDSVLDAVARLEVVHRVTAITVQQRVMHIAVQLVQVPSGGNATAACLGNDAADLVGRCRREP